jgi:hypothetical protein
MDDHEARTHVTIDWLSSDHAPSTGRIALLGGVTRAQARRPNGRIHEHRFGRVDRTGEGSRR